MIKSETLPFISVIIPVYNGERYIEECIDSILMNQYKNMEILVVDDGSVDSTLKILKKYSSEYDNINIIKGEHIGVSHARNIGLKRAKGDFIAYIDSDDYVGATYFLNLIEPMLKDDMIDICCTSLYQFNGDNLKYLYALGNLGDGYIEKQDILIMLFKAISDILCSKLFRKSVLKDFIHHEEFSCLEDTMDMWKLYHKARKIYFTNKRQKFTDTGAYYYRYNPLSSRSQPLEKRLKDKLIVSFNILKEAKVEQDNKVIFAAEDKLLRFYEEMIKHLSTENLIYPINVNNGVFELINFYN